MPEARYRIEADAYLAELVPFCGASAAPTRCSAIYRVHGANNYRGGAGRGLLPPEDQAHRGRPRLVVERAPGLGWDHVPGSPHVALDAPFKGYRLARPRLDPATTRPAGPARLECPGAYAAIANRRLEYLGQVRSRRGSSGWRRHRRPGPEGDRPVDTRRHVRRAGLARLGLSCSTSTSAAVVTSRRTATAPVSGACPESGRGERIAEEPLDGGTQGVVVARSRPARPVLPLEDRLGQSGVAPVGDHRRAHGHRLDRRRTRRYPSSLGNTNRADSASSSSRQSGLVPGAGR